MKRFLLFIVFSCHCVFLLAQPGFIWAKQMGGSSSVYGNSDDIGSSIVVDALNNVYTTGMFCDTVDFDPGSGIYNLISAGKPDIFISKLDASGNFVWAKNIGAIPTEIAIDASGNVYTTGYFIGTTDFDPGTGTLNLTSYDFDIFILKLDASGNFVWAKNMGGTANEEGNSIAVDVSGNVYTTGYYCGTADFDPGSATFNLTAVPAAYNYDIFISKLDASGNFVWAKGLGGPNYDIGESITLDASGNIYITGSFQGTADFDPGTGTFYLTNTSVSREDVFISKLDVSGNFVWAKSIGGIEGDAGRSIAVDASGNVYTTGYFKGTVDFDPSAGNFNLTSVSPDYHDIFISKLDASGNFVWAANAGGAFSDQGYSIALDAANNVHVTGAFRDTADFDPGSGVFNLIAAGFFSFDIFVLKMSQTTVSIKENINVNTIIIYPNPTSGIFQITYSSTKQTKLQCTVFGSKGEIIYSESIPEFQGEYKKTIDLSSKSKGVYFVEIIADKKRAVKKIILN